MEDMSDYRPAMNPAFVQRIQEKRRQEEEARALREHKEEIARLQRAQRKRREEKDEQIRRLRAEARLAQTIRDLNREPPPISAKEIIKIVASKHGLQPAAITGRARGSAIIKARFEAIAEVRRIRPDLSSTQIGRIFGDRDHTTILAALKKMNAQKEAA